MRRFVLSGAARRNLHPLVRTVSTDGGMWVSIETEPTTVPIPATGTWRIYQAGSGKVTLSGCAAESGKTLIMAGAGSYVEVVNGVASGAFFETGHPMLDPDLVEMYALVDGYYTTSKNGQGGAGGIDRLTELRSLKGDNARWTVASNLGKLPYMTSRAGKWTWRGKHPSSASIYNFDIRRGPAFPTGTNQPFTFFCRAWVDSVQGPSGSPYYDNFASEDVWYTFGTPRLSLTNATASADRIRGVNSSGPTLDAAHTITRDVHFTVAYVFDGANSRVYINGVDTGVTQNPGTVGGFDAFYPTQQNSSLDMSVSGWSAKAANAAEVLAMHNYLISKL